MLALLGLLGLILRRGDDEGYGVAKFHDVIDEDFDVVSARYLEFDLAEEGDVGGVEGGVFEAEFDFAFSQDSRLVGGDEANSFGEVADSSGPAIEKAESKGNDGNLGDANEIHDAYQEEVAGDFLANFFTEEGALEIGEYAGGVHEGSIKSVESLKH